MQRFSPSFQQAPLFKLQLCRSLRDGKLDVRDLKAKFDFPPELIVEWMYQYDSGELQHEVDQGLFQRECQQRIEELQCKIDTMLAEIDQLKLSLAAR